jgi:hypothetical protein
MFCVGRDSVFSGENMQQSDDVDIACRSGDHMDGFRNCTINGIIIIMCVRPAYRQPLIT